MTNLIVFLAMAAAVWFTWALVRGLALVFGWTLNLTLKLIMWLGVGLVVMWLATLLSAAVTTEGVIGTLSLGALIMTFVPAKKK